LLEFALPADTHVLYLEEKDVHTQNELCIADHRINQEDVNDKKMQPNIPKKHRKQFVRSWNNDIKLSIRPVG